MNKSGQCITRMSRFLPWKQVQRSCALAQCCLHSLSRCVVRCALGLVEGSVCKGASSAYVYSIQSCPSTCEPPFVPTHAPMLPHCWSPGLCWLACVVMHFCWANSYCLCLWVVVGAPGVLNPLPSTLTGRGLGASKSLMCCLDSTIQTLVHQRKTMHMSACCSGPWPLAKVAFGSWCCQLLRGVVWRGVLCCEQCAHSHGWSCWLPVVGCGAGTAGQDARCCCRP